MDNNFDVKTRTEITRQIYEYEMNKQKMAEVSLMRLALNVINGSYYAQGAINNKRNFPSFKKFVSRIRSQIEKLLGIKKQTIWDRFKGKSRKL